jgi:hypothetical protein
MLAAAVRQLVEAERFPDERAHRQLRLDLLG